MIWPNVPLKDMSMERVRVEEFGESNDKDRGWANFVFSRVSLSKFSVFIQTGHSGYSTSRLERVVSLSHELTTWLDCTFCLVVLQLSWPFSFPTCFTRVPLWRLASRKSIARSSHKTPLIAHILSFLHTFSHTTLTLFPPKYRVSNCWNTSKFGTE